MRFIGLILLLAAWLWPQSSQGRVSRVDDFGVAVTLGHKPGYSAIIKFGENIDIDGAETIWKYGGDYVPPDSADTLFLSSSNANDTMKILVNGLGADTLSKVDSVILTGQTRVQCCISDSGLWYRVHRLHVHNDTQNIAGDVYAFHTSPVTTGVPDTTSKIIGYISNGDNQTQQLFYTVPNDKIGLWYGSSFTMLADNIASAKAIKAEIRFRAPGEPFRIRYPFAVNTNASQHIDLPRLPRWFEPGTDIEVRSKSTSTSGLELTGQMCIILVDTALFRDGFQ